MNNNLENYLLSLKDKPHFKFLHESIDFNQSIRDKHLNNALSFEKQKDQITIEDNYLHNGSNENHYLNVKEWNILYKELIHVREFADNNSDTSKSDLRPLMNQIAKEFCITIPPLLEIFEEHINEHSIGEILHYTLQKLVYTHIRRKQKTEIIIGRVSFSHSLGESLFKYFLYRTKKIFKIFTLGFTQLSEETIKQLDDLLRSILDNDELQTKKLFKILKIYKGPHIVIYKLLSNFILHHMCLLYAKNTLPSVLHTTLEPYYKDDKITDILLIIETKLAQSYVKIGERALSLLVKADIIKVRLVHMIKQQQYQVKFSESLISFFVGKMNIYRPLLCNFNADFMAIEQDNSIEEDLIYENNSDFVHSNPNIHLNINYNCYLTKYKPKIKLSIDRQYLQDFLIYLDNLYKIEHKFSNIDYFKDFLSIYDIDFDSFTKVYYEASKKERAILKNILKFSLDLNNKTNSNILAQIKKLPQHLVGIIKKIYNKIFNNKIFFIGLLQEAILYSIYGYFIVNTFIDARGRLYLQGYNLNIQNFPFAKTFIKPYNPCDLALIENNYSFMQNTFKKRCTYKIIKNKISKMSFETFSKQFNKDKLTYLHKFFDQDQLSLNKLEEYLLQDINFNSSLDFIKKYIKKGEKLFFVHSCILLHKYPTHNLSNYYDIDANSSGIQMTSILFKDEALGKMCNLFGEDNCNLFMLAANTFKSDRKFLTRHINQFKEKINLSIDVGDKAIIIDKDTYEKLKTLSLQEKVNAFLNADLSISYKLPELILDLFNEMKEEFYKNKDEFNSLLKLDWLLSTRLESTLKFRLLQHVDNDFIKYLLIIYQGIKFNKNLTDCSWILDLDLLYLKEVWKMLVMTYGYGSTLMGRIKDIHSFFKKKAPTFLDINSKLNSKLYSIAFIVEYFFSSFKKKYLSVSGYLIDMADILARDMIFIENKFFHIVLRPLVTKRSFVTITGLDKKRQVQLSIRSRIKKLNISALRRGFGPNFIHSMDAYIVHLFHEMLYDINKELIKKNLVANHYTTHDSFMMLITPYLHLLVEDCYHSLIKYDYIHTLKGLRAYQKKSMLLIMKKYFSKDNTQFYLNSECLNRHFMK